MKKNSTIGKIWLAVAVAASAVSDARAEQPLSFSWTAEEICLGGHPGTFTPGGDVTDGFSYIPAYGAGVITFHPLRGTADDTSEWMYFLWPIFVPNPGTPQNYFPARTSKGQCTLTFLSEDHLKFKLLAPPEGCSGPDTSGPNANVVFTFTNGPAIHGQFAADMQSFVASRQTLGLENGLNGQTQEHFERICMRHIRGVRMPASPR